MSSKPTTLFEELALAARGVLALARGDRQAARYFDFSLRGLAGSFLVLVAIIGFMAAQPLFVPGETQGGVAARLFTLVVPVLAQFAGAAIALNQMGRADGFVPYLVCANWTSFLGATVSELLLAVGMDPMVVVLAIGLFTLVVSINIARLVVTLSVGQIVAFFVTQMVAVMFALLIIGLFLPPSPEAVEAAAGTLR